MKIKNTVARDIRYSSMGVAVAMLVSCGGGGGGGTPTSTVTPSVPTAKALGSTLYSPDPNSNVSFVTSDSDGNVFIAGRANSAGVVTNSFVSPSGEVTSVTQNANGQLLSVDLDGEYKITANIAADGTTTSYQLTGNDIAQTTIQAPQSRMRGSAFFKELACNPRPANMDPTDSEGLGNVIKDYGCSISTVLPDSQLILRTIDKASEYVGGVAGRLAEKGKKAADTVTRIYNNLKPLKDKVTEIAGNSQLTLSEKVRELKLNTGLNISNLLPSVTDSKDSKAKLANVIAALRTTKPEDHLSEDYQYNSSTQTFEFKPTSPPTKATISCTPPDVRVGNACFKNCTYSPYGGQVCDTPTPTIPLGGGTNGSSSGSTSTSGSNSSSGGSTGSSSSGSGTGSSSGTGSGSSSGGSTSSSSSGSKTSSSSGSSSGGSSSGNSSGSTSSSSSSSSSGGSTGGSSGISAFAGTYTVNGAGVSGTFTVNSSGSVYSCTVGAIVRCTGQLTANGGGASFTISGDDGATPVDTNATLTGSISSSGSVSGTVSGSSKSEGSFSGSLSGSLTAGGGGPGSTSGSSGSSTPNSTLECIQTEFEKGCYQKISSESGTKKTKVGEWISYCLSGKMGKGTPQFSHIYSLGSDGISRLNGEDKQYNCDTGKLIRLSNYENDKKNGLETYYAVFYGKQSVEFLKTWKQGVLRENKLFSQKSSNSDPYLANIETYDESGKRISSIWYCSNGGIDSQNINGTYQYIGCK